MTDPNTLRKAAIVQMAATMPKIRELMEGLEVSTPSYARLAPGAADLATFGNLADAVERISYDPTAQNDLVYSSIMTTAALVEIISKQQAAIRQLREVVSFERMARAGAGADT